MPNTDGTKSSKLITKIGIRAFTTPFPNFTIFPHLAPLSIFLYPQAKCFAGKSPFFREEQASLPYACALAYHYLEVYKKRLNK